MKNSSSEWLGDAQGDLTVDEETQPTLEVVARPGMCTHTHRHVISTHHIHIHTLGLVPGRPQFLQPPESRVRPATSHGERAKHPSLNRAQTQEGSATTISTQTAHTVSPSVATRWQPHQISNSLSDVPSSKKGVAPRSAALILRIHP